PVDALWRRPGRGRARRRRRGARAGPPRRDRVPAAPRQRPHDPGRRGRGAHPGRPDGRGAALRRRRRPRRDRAPAGARRGGAGRARRGGGAAPRRGGGVSGCAFDLDHYRELLAAARTGGYRFADFSRDPEPGDLILRHDVDLSLEGAVELAELEGDAGVRATYFVMTESAFYNLASSAGEATIATLRSLGHAVGLHAVYPRA